MSNETNYLADFCTDFCNILNKYAKYIVVSGFFVISSGRSRSTEDIDIIVETMSKELFTKFHLDLEKNGFECLQSSDSEELYDYLNENIALRYIKNNIFIPNIELKFAKDVLDNYQIKNRTKIKETGIDVYFGSIESCIAFKEELLKSPKDLDDAKHLRIVYSEKLNEDEIKSIKKIIKETRL